MGHFMELVRIFTDLHLEILAKSESVRIFDNSN